MTKSQVDQNLNRIKENIVDKFKPNKVILFGSQAWGEPTQDSDFDLLVVTETDNTRETAREIDASIFPRPFPVDIMVSTPDQISKRQKRGDFFVKNIFAKGKVLYER